MIAPVVALKRRPGGSDPEVMPNVSGAVPPLGFRLAVYAVPTVPPGGVPASVGSGFTVIATVLALGVPVTAAFNVTERGVAIPAGAVYTTVAPVVFERLPQAEPEEHALPVSE